MWSASYHSAIASKYGPDETLDVVADRRRQLGRVLDDETRPAVERAPDAERGREAVAALDSPVARAQQAEGRPWPCRQHHMAGQRHAVPVEQPDGLALGHPGPKPEQQPADAVRRLTGRVLEGRQLLDLALDAESVAGMDEEVGGVLDEARRARCSAGARRR